MSDGPQAPEVQQAIVLVAEGRVPFGRVGVDRAEVAGVHEVVPQLGDPGDLGRREVDRDVLAVDDEGLGARLPEQAEEVALVGGEVREERLGILRVQRRGGRRELVPRRGNGDAEPVQERPCCTS